MRQTDEPVALAIQETESYRNGFAGTRKVRCDRHDELDARVPRERGTRHPLLIVITKRQESLACGAGFLGFFKPGHEPLLSSIGAEMDQDRRFVLR